MHDVSKDEAMQVHAALRAKANRGCEKPSAVAPTLQTFFDAYFELIAERISPCTASSYRQTAERYLLPRFGASRLSDITAGAVNVWLLELKRERRVKRLPPLAGATLNGYANILRAIVNHAVRFDLIEESPFKKAFDREKVNKPTNELSEAECAAFLGAFDDRDAFVVHLRAAYHRGEVTSCTRHPTPRVFGGSRRWDSDTANEYWKRFRALRPFFVVALTTGLRLGDLCRLSWKDLRWADGWIQLVMEKTEREVVVPISAACEASLRECRARAVVGERVFVDEAGAPLSVTRIRRTFALAKSLAGITRRYALASRTSRIKSRSTMPTSQVLRPRSRRSIKRSPPSGKRSGRRGCHGWRRRSRKREQRVTERRAAEQRAAEAAKKAAEDTKRKSGGSGDGPKHDRVVDRTGRTRRRTQTRRRRTRQTST